MSIQSPIEIDKTMFAPMSGKIKNACFREIDVSENGHFDASKDLSEIYFLPAGQTLSIEAGKSFAIKSSDTTWLRANFYEAGQMTGPLIYSKVKHESPAEALKKSEEFKDRFTRAWQYMMIPVMSLIVLAYGFLTSSHQPGFVMSEASKTNFVLLAILAIGLIFHLSGIILQYYISTRPGCSNDQEALCIFRKLNIQTTKNVSVSSKDLEFIKQTVPA